MKTAIDLGCGSGELTQALQEKLNLQNVLGIDSSSAMLEQAKKLAAPTLQFAKENIATFQPKKTFDLIFSNAALQWLPDHETLIPHILSWVSPGGQIAIQMPYNFDHASHQIAYQINQDLFGGKIEAMGEKPSVLTLERYAEILFKEGFSDISCIMKIYLIPMKNSSDVIEWTKGTLLTSFRSQLSDQDYQKFLDEYQTRLVRALGTGPYLYAYKRILIVGKK